MSISSKIAVTAAAGALAVAGTLAAAGPASAANQDGTCNSGHGTGEVCYYYTNYNSSRSDFFWSDGDLGDNRFISPGPGQYQIVKNNSWATCNFDTRDAVRFYSGTNGTGYSLRLAPWTCYPDLGSFWRDTIESHYWTT